MPIHWCPAARALQTAPKERGRGTETEVGAAGLDMGNKQMVFTSQQLEEFQVGPMAHLHVGTMATASGGAAGTGA